MPLPEDGLTRASTTHYGATELNTCQFKGDTYEVVEEIELQNLKKPKFKSYPVRVVQKLVGERDPSATIAAFIGLTAAGAVVCGGGAAVILTGFGALPGLAIATVGVFIMAVGLIGVMVLTARAFQRAREDWLAEKAV